MRCSFDANTTTSDWLASRLTASELHLGHEIDDINVSTEQAADTEQHLRLPQENESTHYRFKPCARDLVAECRRCGKVVCRNCAAKALSDKFLADRYRRLCKVCLDAPLVEHLQQLYHEEELYAHDHATSSRSSSTHSNAATTTSDSGPTSQDTALDHTEQPSSTSAAFLRLPCTCATRGMYLCSCCGYNLRAHDTTYKRVWRWRSRYSTHIGGGIGTGLGLGNQGQKCGRGKHCLESGVESIAWMETECSDGSNAEVAMEPLSRTTTPMADGSGSPSATNRPGYLQQEVEGIGGVVKKKIKKKVKVGATVYEYDNERKSGKDRGREVSGKQRSWCAWCDRVCLGEQDRQVQMS